MRNKTLLIILFALIATNCSAQKPVFGLSMGVNRTNLIGRDRVEDSKPRLGMCPGINVDIPLVYDTYLEIGAYYSQQGVSVKTDEFVMASVRQKLKVTKFVDYLQVPLYWKQSFGDIYTKVGPFASMAIRASSDWKKELLYGNDSILVEKGHYNSFIKKLRKYDVGAAFAVGYQTSVSRSIDIFFDASYKIGFFSVEEKTDTNKKVLRNQVFCISAGVYFQQNRHSKIYHRR
ncbi:MAG: outer membrane beta-barrel protein [Bacteroidales bacterium]|nr:outer membrane beta-barrel protein [Bacteroidales bacterium]MBR4214164.1 outer membrane beta-barrel protein [Bacteroidales bacterium]